MTGALRLYGLRLRPRYIIWGHTPGFEGRAIRYLEETEQGKKRFTGGIGSSQTYSEEIRANKLGPLKYANAILDVTKFSLMDRFPGLFTNYKGYRPEILEGQKKTL
jgi:hypothetical protein